MEVNKEEINSSGSKDQFFTGAQRDSSQGKGAPYMIPIIALRQLAQHYESGGKLYGALNFHKGMPLSRLYDSATRHLWSWAEGKTNENHLAAALWNISVAIWTEDQIKSGKLPKELSDLPYHAKSD